MLRMHTRYLSLALLFLLLVNSACGRQKSETSDPKNQPPPAASGAVPVTTAAAEGRTVQRTVETTGSLLAWEEVILNTAVSGRLARLLVDLGDRVQGGQVVAEIDKQEPLLALNQAEAALQAARDGLLQARAQVQANRAGLQQTRESRRSWEANQNRAKAVLEEARVNLERSKKLLEGDLIARRDFDAARTQFESALAQYQTAQVEMEQHPDRLRVAEAQLQSSLSAAQVAESEIKQREAAVGIAQKRLADTTLRATIHGVIARRYVNPGEYLKDNSPVFAIVRRDPLKYTGTVSERAALDVHPGQVLRLQVDPVPDRTFSGRITRVSPAIDVTSRMLSLEAEVPNPRNLLKTGLFARGVIEIRQDTGVAFVPETAVSYFVGITKVFVIAGGKAQERKVTVGEKREGAVEIVEGVKPGEEVATSALAQLYDGAPVTVAGRTQRQP